MLQSLLGLPLGAIAEVLLFLLLYRFSRLGAKQAAALVALVAISLVLLYSLVNWPGADVLAMYIAVLAVTAYLLGIVSHSHEARRRAGADRPRWFHWGPAVIIIFFLALFALDGVLVTISQRGLPPEVAEALLPKTGRNEQVQSVFPGTVARDFQKKEARYNDYLEQVKRQEALGWQIDKGWLKRAVAGEPAVFQVRVLESDGAPVRFAEVSGVFLRPSDSHKDTAFNMQEIEPGLYRVVITLPEPGVWDLLLSVKRGEQLHESRGSTSVSAGDRP